MSQKQSLYEVQSVRLFLVKLLSVSCTPLLSLLPLRKFLINNDAQVILSEKQDVTYAYVSC